MSMTLGPRPPRPPRPRNDLRTQVMDRLIETGLAGLAAGDRLRAEAQQTGSLSAHCARVTEQVRRAFGPMPFGAAVAPPRPRTVSAYDMGFCRIENVLFESFPGWEVNASAFVPVGDGPFPAIVVPVGHSGKQFENYQIPAQAFASLGFLAVLFDPPGQATEKQRGNDHFRDGVRSFLFGLTPNRFFVLDALRCVDYLETRPDADLSNGVGMTGVSGGGITTLYAALFDDRVACFGPSCCLNRLADHPVGDAYSSCPEGFWYGRLAAGVDNVDVALAAAMHGGRAGGPPKPMLLMAGKDDEVFAADSTRRLADMLSAGFAAADAPHRFSYFEDDGGHAYSLRQTAQFASWMRRWIASGPSGRDAAGTPAPAEPVPDLDPRDFQVLDYEMLKCRPSQDVNMFTVCRDLAERNSSHRPTGPRGADAVLNGARHLIGSPPPVDDWQETEKFRIWSQGYSEALCRIDEFDIPMSVLRPWPPHRGRVSVLFVDDQGRRHALESGGTAAELSRMLERSMDTVFPELHVPDLPGWGESSPGIMPYQTTSWASMDRTQSYLSYANGDGMIAMVARTAAALADEIARRSESPASATTIVGTGLGGVAALLAAVITEAPVHVAAVSALSAFSHLLEEEHYAWPAAAFLPGSLPVFDLPDLVAALRAGGRRVLIADPRNGARRPLSGERAAELFGPKDVWVDARDTGGRAAVRRPGVGRQAAAPGQPGAETAAGQESPVDRLRAFVEAIAGDTGE